MRQNREGSTREVHVPFGMAVELALAAFDAGRFDQCGALSELLVEEDGRCAIACNLLGVIAARKGKPDDAVAWFARAVDIQPADADSLSNLGNALRESGRLEEALSFLDRAVAADPENPSAWNNRGILQRLLGRPVEALSCFDHVLSRHPGHAEAWNNRGLALRDLGHPGDALTSFARANEANPALLDAWFNRGNLHQAASRHAEALACFDAAAALRDDVAEIHNGRAFALQHLGRDGEALEAFHRVTLLRPELAEAHFNLGIRLHAAGRLEEAVAAFGQAIDRKPDMFDAFSNRGVSLSALKRHEEAMQDYRRAIAVKPDFAEAWNNLATCCSELRRHEEALSCNARALELRPANADFLNNRGVFLAALHRFGESVEMFDAALAANPQFANALYNRGNAMLELRRLDEAHRSYDAAIAIRPDYPEAHWNKSLIHLLTGEMDAGWKLYEWRWRNPKTGLQARQIDKPLWLGGESIEGKTLFIHCEQGLGDIVQFSRYAPLLARRGARVLFEAPGTLLPLLGRLGDGVELVEYGTEPPAFDVHCPLLSLPLALGTDLRNIPADIPYLHVPPERIAHWTRRLGTRTAKTVGLVWSGSATHARDHFRSISLEQLTGALPAGLRYVSLQRDVRESDRAALERHPEILHAGDELRDFADTAALCQLMDVVVTVDTSVAHVAGALGRPVWILLPWVPDWRWMLDREDSPWYPTARLYRQAAHGDWAGVLDRLGANLGEPEAQHRGGVHEPGRRHPPGARARSAGRKRKAGVA